jgi:hypothetical protein
VQKEVAVVVQIYCFLMAVKEKRSSWLSCMSWW